MKAKAQKPKNLATPGKPMSQEVFELMIKQAEEGVFLSLDEFEKKFDAWRLKRKK
jgi:hypothetical protein